MHRTRISWLRFLLLAVAMTCAGVIVTMQPGDAVAAQRPEYDVIIRGGQVYVGDGSEPIKAQVAIRDGRIQMLGGGDKASARRVIDATNLAVTPGFINMLSWSTESLVADGKSESEIRQGVTTQLFGEGQSMGPLNSTMKRRRKAQRTPIPMNYEWNTLAEYLRYLERRGVAQNVGSFVGAATVREYVVGLNDRPATANELESMERLVEREMQDGAFGVGSALIYPPGSYASTEELIALARAAGRYNGLYISHIRSQGSGILEAIDELIRISREADVRAEIYHFGVAGPDNWPKLDQAIDRIEAARRDGLPITANMHAYHAGCTGLTACLPPWTQDGGSAELFKHLANPAARRRIVREIRTSDAYDNPFRAVGSPDRLLLVQFQNPRLQSFEGRTLADVAAERGTDPVETILDLILEDRSRIETVYFTDTEENVRKQIKLPWISFGSDAVSMGTDGVFRGRGTHPRAFGNFARVLGKYVRDEKLISLEAAIYRMTGLPAANLRLDRRGLLRNGYFADVIVFDPNEIADRATFEDPHQYAVGMRHVFVNGEHVLDDGRHTGRLPGRAIYGPGKLDRSDDREVERADRNEQPPSRSNRIIALAQRSSVSGEDAYSAARLGMVKNALEKAEPPITNPQVLDAMRTTPRHLFVAEKYRRYAYNDNVLPIGYGQTISPPYIVAYMTEKIDPQPNDRVLEIGTGSGYQAAVLSPLVREVYTIEIVEQLGRRAAETLKRLGYDNVFAKVGDGYKGWPEHAPFDKIIVTCSPDHVPQPLIDQLREGGTMIIPVGERYQQSFYLMHKRDGKLERKRLLATFFVPMTGEAERQRQDNPDGSRPAIANGNFELGTDEEGGPESWYYQRGVTLVDTDAPQGKHYALYSNDEPNFMAHSNQAFALDGRRVESLNLSFWVSTQNVRSGAKSDQVAGIHIFFYDKNRSPLGGFRAGPYQGSTGWRHELVSVPVPAATHDAVLVIGLNGATGQVGFDDLFIEPLMRRGR